MSKSRKDIHTDYCNYMIQKANNNRTYSVKCESNRQIKGVRQLGLSRNELIFVLAN